MKLTDEQYLAARAAFDRECTRGLSTRVALRAFIDAIGGVWLSRNDARALRIMAAISPSGHELQTRLSEQLEPDRPPEPTGQYAIVEDVAGRAYVRTLAASNTPGAVTWNGIGSDEWVEYGEILGPITIKSTGVHTIKNTGVQA